LLFAGGCWWRSSAIYGDSGAPRGHRYPALVPLGGHAEEPRRGRLRSWTGQSG
jgi:hypothetical protein